MHWSALILTGLCSFTSASLSRNKNIEWWLHYMFVCRCHVRPGSAFSTLPIRGVCSNTNNSWFTSCFQIKHQTCVWSVSDETDERFYRRLLPFCSPIVASSCVLDVKQKKFNEFWSEKQKRLNFSQFTFKLPVSQKRACVSVRECACVFLLRVLWKNTFLSAYLNKMRRNRKITFTDGEYRKLNATLLSKNLIKLCKCKI